MKGKAVQLEKTRTLGIPKWIIWKPFLAKLKRLRIICCWRVINRISKTMNFITENANRIPVIQMVKRRWLLIQRDCSKVKEKGQFSERLHDKDYNLREKPLTSSQILSNAKD